MYRYRRLAFLAGLANFTPARIAGWLLPRAVMLQPLTDNQVELAIGIDPFLFAQARLDDTAASHRQPDRRFMELPVNLRRKS